MTDVRWPKADAIIKVGGSLFDLPDLAARLRRLLADLDRRRTLLVAGGGEAARLVRELDRIHAIGNETAHWLALRCLTLNTHTLHALLPEVGPVVGTPAALRGAWRRRAIPILDGYRFARADEGSPGALPHSWDATSDSLAARAAVLARAPLLVLLKSCSLPAGADVGQAVRAGILDPYFPTALSTLAATARPPEVRIVNLRSARELSALGRPLPTRARDRRR